MYRNEEKVLSPLAQEARFSLKQLFGSAINIALPFFFFALVGLLLQFLCGAYANDFGSHPDEPAHFMSGVLVHDFLISFKFFHPMEYARNYYLHYPKIAIGQWPMLLYFFLGGWFLLTDVSRASAMAFQLLVTASIATVIYVVGKRQVSRVGGILAALLFLLSPVVQINTSRMMSDGAGALFVLLASLAFARFFSSGKTVDALLFGVLSTVAILTRGSGWALGLVPLIVIIIGRRFDLLKKPSLWATAAIVLIACVPFYALTIRATEGTWGGRANSMPYWLLASKEFASTIWRGLGPFVLLPALLGLWNKIIQPFRKKEIDAVWGVLFAYPIATWLLLCALPTGAESRFMVALFPAVLLFAVAGLDQLASYLPAGVLAPDSEKRLVCFVVAILFLASTFHIPKNLVFSGFGQIVPCITKTTGKAKNVVLVASDSEGEGAVVAAIAMAESRPTSYVLRGTKVFAKENWCGSRIVERCNSVSNVSDLLNRIPVNVVVIDDSVSTKLSPRYFKLLCKALQAQSAMWRQASAFSVVRGDKKYPAALRVFVKQVDLSEVAQNRAVNLELIKSLDSSSSAGAYLR